MTKAKATALPKAFEGGADPDALRLLDAGGALIEGAVVPLVGDRLLEGYRSMLFSRALDERGGGCARRRTVGFRARGRGGARAGDGR